MPSRKHKQFRKCDSSEVQGEDSFVILKTVSWADVNELIVGKSLDSVDEAELGLAMICAMVHNWNWVDDDDNPLPQPTPEIIKALPVEELIFLGSLIDMKS